MYVGFRSFLGALVIVGLGLGAVFGLGVTVGGGKPAPADAASGAGGSGGGGTGAGGQAISGTVDSATATSLVVRVTDGSTVTLALTERTVIRKTETGSAQDLRAGVQVLATREGASNAATVSIVPAGSALPAPGGGARGPGAGASATPGARGTATP